MKAIVLTVDDSDIPEIQLKPETASDRAVLNAILNRNGDAVQPDTGYTVKSFTVNGSSYSSVILGATDGLSSGSATNAKVIAGANTATYQDDDLIDKTILFVFVDSAVRIPSDYAFTTETGTIVFDNSIDTGAIIQVMYKN